MNNINPSAKPVLSLCAIVKNEAENLPRCLASAKPYVDEMIVVDTGSEDGTPEIALSFGAKVSYFKWCDDFAAARNYSLSQASGDWILVLDADEELIVDTENFKQQLTSNSEVMVYAMVLETVNVKNVIGGFYGRIFRNLPNVRYVYRYHEQLEYQGEQNIVYDRLEGIKIIHYGNNTEERVIKKAATRDIPILEIMRKEEGLSPWLLDCLARKYTRLGQTEKAEQCYAEILDKLSPNLLEGTPPKDFFWVPTLVQILGTRALEEGDYETAQLICQRGLEWCSNYPPINILAGEVIRLLGFPLGAIAYFEKCIQMGEEGNYYVGEPFELSFLTVYPAFNIGCTYMEMQRHEDALAAFEQALKYDANFTPAQEKIDEIKQVLVAQSIRQEEKLNLKILDSLVENYSDRSEMTEEFYAEAFDLLQPNLISGNKPEPFNFIPSLMYSIGIKTLQEKDYETARLVCQRGLEWCHDYPPINYLAGAILKELGFPWAAIAYFKNCLQLDGQKTYYKNEPFDRSLMTTYPAYDMGEVYNDIGQPKEAIAAFEMVLSFDPNFTAALEKIQQIQELLVS